MTAHGCGPALLACLLLAGCSRGEEATTPQQRADTVPAAPRVAALSDAEALDVLMALSTAGAETAGSATPLIAAPEARRYLSVVVADHLAAQAELQAIADSLQLSPGPHPAAIRLRTAAQESTAELAQLTYGGADLTLLQRQLQMHTLFLSVLDSAVLSEPRVELLAQYAQAFRPTVAAHRLRAEQLAQLLRERPVARRAATSPPRPPPPGDTLRPRLAIPRDTGLRAPPDTTG